MKNKDFNKKRLESVSKLNKAIHEPSRLLVITILSMVEETDFLFMLSQTGLTKGNLSAQLIKLEKAGLVVIKKEFFEKVPRTILKISEQGIKELEEYKKNISLVLEG